MSEIHWHTESTRHFPPLHRSLSQPFLPPGGSSRMGAAAAPAAYPPAPACRRAKFPIRRVRGVIMSSSMLEEAPTLVPTPTPRPGVGSLVLAVSEIDAGRRSARDGAEADGRIVPPAGCWLGCAAPAPQDEARPPESVAAAGASGAAASAAAGTTGGTTVRPPAVGAAAPGGFAAGAGTGGLCAGALDAGAQPCSCCGGSNAGDLWAPWLATRTPWLAKSAATPPSWRRLRPACGGGGCVWPIAPYGESTEARRRRSLRSLRSLRCSLRLLFFAAFDARSTSYSECRRWLWLLPSSPPLLPPLRRCTEDSAMRGTTTSPRMPIA